VAHRDRLVAALRSQGLHAYLLTYFSPFLVVFPGRYGGKVKVKVHTLNDIATPEDISFPSTTASITLITVWWS